MTSPRRQLALAVAATAAALVLAGCGDDPSSEAADPGATDDASSPSSPAETTATSDPAPSETGRIGSADSTTVPVYFVGDGPNGPLLFREFRKVEADNPLDEAAALLTAGDTVDPDYRTLFPGGAFGEITYDEAGSRIEVTLSDDGWTIPGPGMSAADAKLAVQSLVYTLQGVAQARAPIFVTLGGEATTLFGVDTSNGVEAAPPFDVLNLVNVTAPEEGATVSGSFTAKGVASSFEATVPWQIRQGDQVVEEGFSTAEGWMDKLYPWETEVDVSGLAPGEYVFAAMTDDPSGGAEGHGPSEDTKTIVVE
ncbi:MAG: GerMN domain-containing protein [Actinomycetota bacterium]|nr:GerMN domain-containing protein [Actinomycetota bacterium]